MGGNVTASIHYEGVRYLGGVEGGLNTYVFEPESIPVFATQCPMEETKTSGVYPILHRGHCKDEKQRSHHNQR